MNWQSCPKQFGDNPGYHCYAVSPCKLSAEERGSVELGIAITVASGCLLRFRATAEMELNNAHISDPAWDRPERQIVVRIWNRSNAPYAWKIGDEIAVMTIQSRSRVMPLSRQLSDASGDSTSMGFLDDYRSISLAQTSAKPTAKRHMRQENLPHCTVKVCTRLSHSLTTPRLRASQLSSSPCATLHAAVQPSK